MWIWGLTKILKLQLYCKSRAGKICFYAPDRTCRTKVHVWLRKQLEPLLFVIYYLNRSCSFDFKCISIKSFCNEACVVRILFEFLNEDASQGIIFIIQTHPSKVFQKICWKHVILLNINAATDPLIMICWKIFEQIFLRTAQDRCFW